MNFLFKTIFNFFENTVKPGLNYKMECSSELSSILIMKIGGLVDKISISALNNFIMDIEKGKELYK